MTKKSQAETAYDAIKQRILCKQIVPGQAIFETDLAKELDMSRTPVREAIKRLTAEGLLEMIKGRGTFLRIMTVDQLINCYEVSEGLEGMLAYHLAERRKSNRLADADISAAEALIEKMEQAASEGNIPLWVKLDTEFHTRLHKACDNPYLRESLERLQSHFDSVSLFLLPLYINTDKDVASQEHRDMIHHIKKGNPQKAREAAQRQRCRVRNFMINLTRAQ